MIQCFLENVEGKSYFRQKQQPSREMGDVKMPGETGEGQVMLRLERRVWMRNSKRGKWRTRVISWSALCHAEEFDLQPNGSSERVV